MIALGDVSVTGKEIAVTHTRYVFVETNWDGGIASPALAGPVQLTSVRKVAVFDGPGRSDLRHDAGRQPVAGLNARSL